MAFKTVGSNALKADAGPDFEVDPKDGSVEVKVNIRTKEKNSLPEGWSVDQGSKPAGVANSGTKPNLEVIDPGDDSGAVVDDVDATTEDFEDLDDKGGESAEFSDEAEALDEQNTDDEEQESTPDETGVEDKDAENKDDNKDAAENPEEKPEENPEEKPSPEGENPEGEQKAPEETPETPEEKPEDQNNQAANGDQQPSDQDQKADEARNTLKDNEKAAAKETPEQPKDDIDGAKKFEKDSADQGFKNSTEGKKKDKKTIDPRKKLLNRLKQQSTLGALIAFILCIAFMIAGMQPLLPFSVSEALRTNNDSISVSNNRRATSIFLKQLGKKKVNSPQSSNQTNYEVSGKQRNKLAKEGIYIVDSGDTSVALYDDGSGKLKIVAADGTDATTLKNKVNFDDIQSQLPAGYSGPRSIDNDDISVYSSKIKSDANFETKFANGSRTWTTAVSAWFDARTVRFLKSNFLTRNLFKNYIQKKESGDTDSDAGNLRKISQMIDENTTSAKKGQFDKDEMEINKKTDGDGDDSSYNQNDKSTKKNPVDVDDLVDANAGNSFSSAKAKAEAVFDKISPSKLTTSAQNLVCLVLDIAGSAALVGAAHDVAQILPVVSAFLESVDKHKAGDGDGSISDFATALTATAATTLVTSNNGSYEATSTEPKSAMESDALSSLIDGTKMNPDDPVTSSFNMGGFNNNFGGLLGSITSLATNGATAVAMFRACSLTKLVFNSISAAGSFASLALTVGGCILGPAGCAVGALSSVLFNAVKKVAVASVYTLAIQKAISLVSAFLVPKLAMFFMRNIVYDLAGESFGAVLVNGAQKYISGNHRFGGGSLASRQSYIAFAAEQQEYLAKTAELERATRSPFDATSQYTFAGSLLRQLAVFNSSSSSSPLKLFSTVGSLTQKSLVSMMPSVVATAGEISETLMSDEELNNTCPSLASIGAVGDAFCNPYIITDTTTIEADVDSVANFVASKGSFKSDGSIDPKSDLAKYITYCGSRGSPFGTVDGNISSAVSSGTTVDTGNRTLSDIINATISATPVIGDTLDVLTEESKLENIGWITGESCVANNEEDGDWKNETKYYQRYVEDQRLLENISDNYTSPVTAYIEQYYEENPIDESYEGILAYYSGLTKDEVVATLDAIEYINYVAEYEPETRYDFIDGDLIKPEPEIYFDSPDLNGVQYSIVPVVKYAYADPRHHFTTSA